MMGYGRLLFAMAMIAGADAKAHGGGLNAEGCHNNRKTGDYHCHRGAAVPPVRPMQLQAADNASAPAPHYAPAAQSGRPTCYTGPRGGTYTITSSGRKNYSGC